MVDEKKSDVKPSEEKKKITETKFIANEEEKNYIRELQKDLEIIERPFLKSAQKLGITEEHTSRKGKAI